MNNNKKSNIVKSSIILFLIFFVGIILYYFFGIKKPLCKDCNIILISLDTLSANHLPCYGYDRNTAPNLCKFGEENIIFENAFSNASWTLPSHVSIFTGLYPSQHKMYDWDDEQNLSQNVLFLPEILQKNGYKTYFYMPNNNFNLPINRVYNRGINEIVDTSKESDWSKGLQQLSLNNSAGQKTFLFLHTFWVHSPYIPINDKESIFVKDLNNSPYLKIYKKYLSGVDKCSPDFLEYLRKALDEDKDTILKNNKSVYEPMRVLLSNEDKSAQFCSIYENSDHLDLYYRGYANYLINIKDPKIVDNMKDLYDMKIAELDAYLKKVFAYVKNSELKKNTIIIVTADHGEEFMEHGSWTHGTNLFDTSIKVPLIMYVPGLTNKKITQVAESVDIVPTLLNILNIKSTYVFAGSDLLTNILFKTTKYAISQEQRENSGTIRDDMWKLFYKIENNKALGVQLYNYKKDPQEKNNIIFQNPKKARELLQKHP